MGKLRLLHASTFFLLVLPLAVSQQDAPPATTYLPNQEVHVDGLPFVKAESNNPSAVLVAALETMLHDKRLCCGRDDALGDSVLSADPLSLKDVSVKLQGRQHLSDGRPIVVTAEFMPSGSINSGQIVGTIRDKYAMLMQWNSHLYVLYGVIFDETYDSGGGMVYAVRKLLLIDPRFSDARRMVSFNRETDDLAKVQGILTLRVTVPQ